MDEYLGNYSYYENKQKELKESSTETYSVNKTQLEKEKKKKSLKKNEIKKIKQKIKDVEIEMEDIDSRIDELTELTLMEDFYNDQDKVKETFEEIKSLENKKESLSDQWFELNISLEE